MRRTRASRLLPAPSSSVVEVAPSPDDQVSPIDTVRADPARASHRTAARPPRVEVRDRRRLRPQTQEMTDGVVIVNLGDVDVLAERIKKPEAIRLLARLLLNAVGHPISPRR